jgi:hypothetical protein
LAAVWHYHFSVLFAGSRRLVDFLNTTTTTKSNNCDPAWRAGFHSDLKRSAHFFARVPRDCRIAQDASATPGNPTKFANYPSLLANGITRLSGKAFTFRSDPRPAKWLHTL